MRNDGCAYSVTDIDAKSGTPILVFGVQFYTTALRKSKNPPLLSRLRVKYHSELNSLAFCYNRSTRMKTEFQTMEKRIVNYSTIFPREETGNNEEESMIDKGSVCNKNTALNNRIHYDITTGVAFNLVRRPL